jgi:hypothetical protein
VDPAAAAATDHLNWLQRSHPMWQAPTMVQARGALLYGRLGSLADGSHSLSKHGGFTLIIPHDVAFF